MSPNITDTQISGVLNSNVRRDRIRNIFCTQGRCKICEKDTNMHCQKSPHYLPVFL